MKKAYKNRATWILASAVSIALLYIISPNALQLRGTINQQTVSSQQTPIQPMSPGNISITSNSPQTNAIAAATTIINNSITIEERQNRIFIVAEPSAIFQLALPGGISPLGENHTVTPSAELWTQIGAGTPENPAKIAAPTHGNLPHTILQNATSKTIVLVVSPNAQAHQ